MRDWVPAPFSGQPDTQAPLSKAYLELAKDLKASVAPVGVAWEMAFKDNTDEEAKKLQAIAWRAVQDTAGK